MKGERCAKGEKRKAEEKSRFFLWPRSDTVVSVISRLVFDCEEEREGGERESARIRDQENGFFRQGDCFRALSLWPIRKHSTCLPHKATKTVIKEHALANREHRSVAPV